MARRSSPLLAFRDLCGQAGIQGHKEIYVQGFLIKFRLGRISFWIAFPQEKIK